MQKSIIFDVGDVIALHGKNKTVKYIQKEYSIKKDFSKEYGKLIHARDLGKINAHQFIQKLSEKLKVKINEKKLFDAEYYKIVKPNKPVLMLIKKLSKKYPLFIFSNNSQIGITYYKKTIGFEKYFEKCIYSYKIGVTKPNPQFFRKGLQLIKRNGKDCIFIDDKKKFKKGAERFGITFIHYKNPKQLKQKLKKLKII